MAKDKIVHTWKIYENNFPATRRGRVLFAYLLNLSLAKQTKGLALKDILWHNQICFKPKPNILFNLRFQIEFIYISIWF